MSLSLLGTSTLTRRRYASGAYDSDGLWSDGSGADTTFEGSLQPLSGRDREVLPEGLRSSSSKKVYCEPGTLRIDDQRAGVRADEVVVGTDVYTVVHVDTYTQPLPLVHDRAFLARRVEGS